jgi:hypothetical protein
MWYLSFSDQTASFLAMPGWGKKAVDPDRIHPVLSMFLDRREELFFFIFIFSFSFFLFFFFFFSFCEKPYCIPCKQMASFPSGISNN